MFQNEFITIGRFLSFKDVLENVCKYIAKSEPIENTRRLNSILVASCFKNILAMI